MIDFNALVDELDSSGPTVAEVTRSRRQDDLMGKVLEALSKPQAVPNVTVNPEISRSARALHRRHTPRQPTATLPPSRPKPTRW